MNKVNTNYQKQCILDFLSEQGHNPLKIQCGSAWFLSPIREEKTASFKVNLNRDLWYDFGLGTGGNLVELKKKMRRNESMVSFRPYKPLPSRSIKMADSDEKDNCIKILSIRDLKHPALISYCLSRKVSLSFAGMFVKEATYTVHQKKYFALAFRNDLGGFELRSPLFKTCSSPKFYTTIPGEDSSRVNVFEGFMDFLSCCTFYKRTPAFKTIILNSLSFIRRIHPILQTSSAIHLFLDNDQAGKTASGKLIDLYENVTNRSSIVFPDHKDFNDFIISCCK